MKLPPKGILRPKTGHRRQKTGQKHASGYIQKHNNTPYEQGHPRHHCALKARIRMPEAAFHPRNSPQEALFSVIHHAPPQSLVESPLKQRKWKNEEINKKPYNYITSTYTCTL